MIRRNVFGEKSDAHKRQTSCNEGYGANLANPAFPQVGE